jgi:large subunit ribosomal protein L13
VDTLSYKTISANSQSVNTDWYIVDAEGQTLGRLCSPIASVLRGKNKPSFTPNADCGDCVIVVNAEKVHLTGKKLTDKDYITYSGYPGGQKRKSAQQVMDKKPTAIVEKAVRGMLPKTKLGRQQFKKLFVYEGSQHKHHAQKPQTLNI